MLVIRLSRTGKKKQAYFRIVVAEKERAVGSKFIEILGNYNPHEKKFEINKEKLQEYLKNGAQPSNTLAKILKKEKIELPKWVKIVEKKKSPKKQEESGPAVKKSPKEESVSEGSDATEEKTDDATSSKENPKEEETSELKEEKSENEESVEKDLPAKDESGDKKEEPSSDEALSEEKIKGQKKII